MEKYVIKPDTTDAKRREIERLRDSLYNLPGPASLTVVRRMEMRTAIINRIAALDAEIEKGV